jgi:hypothetical protein
VRVDVVRRDKRAGRVVDESGELGRDVLRWSAEWPDGIDLLGNISACCEHQATHKSLQRVLEHGSDVVALDVGRTEALCPADKLCDTSANVTVSCSRHTHRHGQCEADYCRGQLTRKQK